jgi:uncharacterized protein DUF3501
MKPVTVQDLMPVAAYEQAREGFRRRIIGLKQDRRIQLGELVSLVFENRETLLFQVQEMIRTEHIIDSQRIQEEVDTYNLQIPGRGELSATLFIEVTDVGQVKEVLDRFQGIDQGQTLGIRLGQETVYGVFEQGRTKEDKISAVHYVRFHISERMKSLLARFNEPLEMFIHHSGYQASTLVPDKMRLSLLQDLQ